MGERINHNHHLGHADDHDFQVPNLNLGLNIQPNYPQLRHPASASSTSACDKQLFGCRSCNRVFYSSQALGGHMNAHRKETRAAFKKCNFKNKQPRKKAGFMVSGSSLHSLGLVGPHTLFGQEMSQEKSKFGPRHEQEESKFRVPNMHDTSDVQDVASWPRSYKEDCQKLDLNLRL